MKTYPKGSKKLLNAWAFYDWANSVYTLTIASSIFPIFYSALFVSNLKTVEAFGFEFKNTALITFVTAFTFIVIAFMSPLLSGIADYVGNKKNFLKFFEIVLSVTIVWLCSSELIHWLSLSGTSDVYKFGLTILWGVFSFLLIGYGIWKKKKHLRITSIILFAGTIIKLFVYDINNLETVPKTIVFISIGGLLLVVSFMYNKYRNLIFGQD